MAIEDVGSATSLATITPSNTVVLNCRAIWVGTGGTLVVTALEDDTTVTLLNVPGGYRMDIAAKHVNTGTTATGLVAMK